MGMRADHGRCKRTIVVTAGIALGAQRRPFGPLAAIAVLSLASACSAIVDSDAAKLGAPPTTCMVGRSVSCPCPDGTTSTQVCNKLQRYDVCACKGQAGRAGQVSAPPAGRSGAGGAGSGAAGRAGTSATAGRTGAAGH
jgi:hypothetical protein